MILFCEVINFLDKNIPFKYAYLKGIKNCFSWPTRTRTLNDGTKNRCVTNYTIGQCFYAGANLMQSFKFTNYFLQILYLTNFYELIANEKNP